MINELVRKINIWETSLSSSPAVLSPLITQEDCTSLTSFTMNDAAGYNTSLKSFTMDDTAGYNTTSLDLQVPPPFTSPEDETGLANEPENTQRCGENSDQHQGEGCDRSGELCS